MDDSYPVRWTYILIAFTIVVFIAQNFTEGWEIFMFYPAYAFAYPWMFVTSIFLHAGIDHILVNMIVLFYFGTYLERRVGPRSFLLVFFVSGIIGNIGYMITSPDPFTPSLGASGAIYGVMGALAVLAPLLIVFVGFMVPVPMVLAVIGYSILDYTGLFLPDDVAHGAHLGGLVIGILLGFYLRFSTREKT